jgi:diguanylate cyclase (GGDEF)-like protein/PAS domain S-box-containing protein
MAEPARKKAGGTRRSSNGRRSAPGGQAGRPGDATGESRIGQETAEALLNAPAQSTDSALLIDRDGVVIAVSQSFAHRHGVTPDQMVGSVVYDHFDPARAARRRRQTRRVVRSGRPERFEDRVDGRISEISIHPIHDDQGRVVRLVVFGRDITAERQTEAELKAQTQRLERLRRELEESTKSLTLSKRGLQEKSLQLQRALNAQEELARLDPLTHALNHGAIMETIGVLTSRQAAKFAVILADVDSMKRINDTFGHQTGDAVLIEVAKALSLGKAIVGRYGGDEFLVVLPGANRAVAERYLAQVRDALASIEQADAAGKKQGMVSVSLGLAVWPEDGETSTGLIEAADAAMYDEKRSLGAVASGRRGGDADLDRLGLELTALLMEERGPEEAMQAVCDRLAAAWRCDVTRLVLVDASAYRSVSTYRPDFITRGAVGTLANEAADREMLKLLVREGRPLVVPDMLHEGRFALRQRTAALTAGIRSGLIAPLLWRRDLKGILLLFNRRRAAFNPAVVASAEATADLLGALLVRRVLTVSAGSEDPAAAADEPLDEAPGAAPRA